MNTHVSSNSVSESAPLIPHLPRWSRRFLGVTNAAQQVADEARAHFRADNPRVEHVGLEKQRIAARIAREQQMLERLYKAKDSTELVRERFGGKFSWLPSLFDTAEFILLFAATGIGLGMAWTGLAAYVSDSGLIQSLSDNFLRSLLISAAPISGSFGLKAIGNLLVGDRQKRRYFLALGGLGIVALLIHVGAMSAVFAPQHDDLSRAAGAIAAGESLDASKAGLSDLASMIVLGSQLVAELFLAPVIMHAVANYNHATRKLEVVEHERQAVYDKVIVEVSDRIQQLSESFGTLCAEQETLQLREAAAGADASEAFNLAKVEYEQAMAREQRRIFESNT